MNRIEVLYSVFMNEQRTAPLVRGTMGYCVFAETEYATGFRAKALHSWPNGIYG